MARILSLVYGPDGRLARQDLEEDGESVIKEDHPCVPHLLIFIIYLINTTEGPTPVLVEFLKSKQKFPKVDERTSRASTQTAPPATPKQGSAAQPFVIESSPEPEDIASKATPPISKGE